MISNGKSPRPGPPSFDFSPAVRYFRTMKMGWTAALLVVLVCASCDGGLEPPPAVKPGFGGTIRFVRSSWPAADSIYGLWTFTSQQALADSAAIFTGLFSDPPTIYLYPGLTSSLGLLPADSIKYEIYPAPEPDQVAKREEYDL